MLVYTDSTDYAQTVLGRRADLWSVPASEVSDDLRSLIERAYGAKEIRASTVQNGSPWHHLLLVEVAERSHFDLMIELGRSGVRLPDRVLCLAGAGERFHGFKGRRWSAPRGNIYLSAHLRPNQAVERPASSFTVLAAVSVVDAIDAMPGLEKSAGIKWVNDILIDGAKVAGVLAYTQSAGESISGAVLGIGVNVETEPDVAPTPFVPRVGALKSMAPRPEACTQRRFFTALVAALDANYGRLLAGGYEALLDRYRERALVIGRRVTLCSDEPGDHLDVMAQGRVTGIGEGLELVIEGYERPFTKGRLVAGSLEDFVSRKR
ncbi:MAG: biotin--[acetyl-CoA-carboxylase] ligase [Gemmatimonadales bacterium]|jgi:BirA family biotin operon repressor/biotin-[acetyl-CoA-carboxylase] ligase